MSNKLTTEEFIAKAKAVHDDKYDYSKVSYINAHAKVCIICPIHGEFWQAPNNHLSSRQGCPHCCGTLKLTQQEFVAKAKTIHGDKYDYSKVEYVNHQTKICIICPIHGEFWQRPNDHLNGKGCKKCGNASSCQKNKKKAEQFIADAKLVHGDKYDYSKVEYVNNRTKVCIACPTHGEFWQAPHEHLQGNGCQKCKNSKGELKIRSFLKRHNVCFLEQKKFEECKNVRTLPFDFYLPNFNLCIEFQGKQHYKVVDFYGGTKGYKERQINDKIKREWCSKPENPNLLEINDIKKIDEILEGIIL